MATGTARIAIRHSARQSVCERAGHGDAARARKFSPTACAIRGATALTGRPARCGSAMSARICGRKWILSSRAATTAGASAKARIISSPARAGAQYIEPVMEYTHRPNLQSQGNVSRPQHRPVRHRRLRLSRQRISRARRRLHLRRLQSRHDLGFPLRLRRAKSHRARHAAAAAEKHRPASPRMPTAKSTRSCRTEKSSRSPRRSSGTLFNDGEITQVPADLSLTKLGSFGKVM